MHPLSPRAARVGEHTEQAPDRAHVERDENDPPFHHGRLGVAAVLIYGNISRRGESEKKPTRQELVDRQHEHRTRSPLGLGPDMSRPGYSDEQRGMDIAAIRAPTISNAVCA